MTLEGHIITKNNLLKGLLNLGYICFFVLLLSSCKTGKDTNEKHPGEEAQKFKITFHEAIREKMMGNYDIAIGLFEKCLVLDNTSSASNYALSDLYQLQGDKSKAIFYGEKAYELDKENKWYKLNLAHLYFDMGHYHKSAEFFELGIDENEKNLELKFKYAEALIFSNQHKKAISVIDDIELETGKSPELSLTKHDLYLELGEEEKAQKELDDLMNANPGNNDNKLIVAEYFMQTNQLDKASSIANEIIESDTTVGGAYIILADINLRNGEVESAFDYLEAGFIQEGVEIERKLELIWSLVPYVFVETNSDAEMMETRIAGLFELIYDESLKSDLLHTYYGVFLKDQGKYEESKKQFKLAIAINPSMYNYWMNLLNIEYELDDFEGMMKDGESAIELFPAQPMFYLLTGIGAYEAGSYDTADEWLFLGKDLVVKDPELEAEFLYHMGKVLCLQKDYQGGYKKFEEAKQLFPKGLKMYNAKALFLIEENKLDEAEIEINKGLDIMPISPNLLDTYGVILTEKKQYEDAIDQFKKALLNDPYNGLIMEHYGDALFLKGDKEEAFKMWEDARDNGNDNALLNKKIADQTYYEN